MLVKYILDFLMVLVFLSVLCYSARQRCLLRHERTKAMSDERFFRSSRGRIIETLRKRGPCTVEELSEAIGVSPNAIRQHVAVLEHAHKRSLAKRGG